MWIKTPGIQAIQYVYQMVLSFKSEHNWLFSISSEHIINLQIKKTTDW